MTGKLLPIGTYQYANEQAGARKLVNCTAEKAPPDSGNVVILRRMPGISSFATAGSKIRGYRLFNGSLYVVSGASLYKISSVGSVTEIGRISGAGRVSMSDNGTTMVIVANPVAYQSDGSSVSQITDSVFLSYGPVSDVDFLDGYLIFTVANSRTSFVSGLNALTFDALDFTTIDGSTDKLLGLIVDHREIIFLKERSTEIWYNAARPTGYPMARSPNGYLETGCAAADTAAKIGGAVYWLADDGTVRQLSGATPSIVSNIGMAKYIADTDDAYGFAYTFEDKHYYVLSLPGVTLEYDILAQEWHNRETFAKSTWEVLGSTRAYGSTFMFSSTSGAVGKVSRDIRTEFGGIQKVAWTYQEIKGDGNLVSHNRLELNIGTGVGLTSGQGSDPQIELLISNDGGKVFESFGTKSLGQIGNYLDRVVWHKLGSSRHRVYRCGITDAVDVIAFGTEVDLTGGGF